MNLYIPVHRLQVVRPFNEADIVFLAKPSLLLIELLSGQKSLLAAEKVDRMEMLDSLIFDRCAQRRDVEIKALASQPGRPGPDPYTTTERKA